MINCASLKHPFKTDPGTSQNARILEQLLSGAEKIDNRNLARMLNQFSRMARHVNYYDEKLEVKDWRSFFGRSAPFVLSGIACFPQKETEKMFGTLRQKFLRKRSRRGLILLLESIHRQLFSQLANWHKALEKTDLGTRQMLEKMMREQVGNSLKNFIGCANAAKNKFGLPAIDLTIYSTDPAWGLNAGDLSFEDTSYQQNANSYFKKLGNLYQNLFNLIKDILGHIAVLGETATQELDHALQPLEVTLRQTHAPHLALIFAFLRLFRHLQDDQNQLTQKHLDHFYNAILQIRPKEEKPDHVHLVLGIQQQLSTYLVKHQTIFKGGKDLHNIDILFSGEQEIVLNKATVAQQKMIFLDHDPMRLDVDRSGCKTYSFVEGVYVAEDHTMADGAEQPFASEPPSRKAFGSRLSKYIDPEFGFTKPYSGGRLGFVLASPVLYLQEGEREVQINLSCALNPQACADTAPETRHDPCCQKEREQEKREAENKRSAAVNETQALIVSSGNCDPEVSGAILFTKIKSLINDKYYYINRKIIAEFIKMGMTKALQDKLEKFLTVTYKRKGKANPALSEQEDPSICYCGRKEQFFEVTLPENKFLAALTPADKAWLAPVLKPIKALDVAFSGEKGWLTPDADQVMLKISGTAALFSLQIMIKLTPENDKVGIYKADTHKENLNTELPLVRVILNDKIKIPVPSDQCRDKNTSCCERPLEEKTSLISLYHFFREVKATASSTIDVKVCGLKNVIVQNDESLQDVNAPVYPFGTRPEVIDFDCKTPFVNTLVFPDKNMIGPNFYIGSQEIFLKAWKTLSLKLKWKDKPDNFRQYYQAYCKQGTAFGLDPDRFMFNVSILDDGGWKGELPNAHTQTVQIKGASYQGRRLFANNTQNVCNSSFGYQNIFLQQNNFGFTGKFRPGSAPLKRFDTSTRNGFIRLNLQVQDFCHKEYAYVLARQMMALGKLPKEHMEGAVYYDGITNSLIMFDTNTIKQDVNSAATLANQVDSSVNGPSKLWQRIGISGNISSTNLTEARGILFPPGESLVTDAAALRAKLDNIKTVIGNTSAFQAIIPNEPWTPVVQSMMLDYTASATSTDIELIHLYPHQDCHKPESLDQSCPLFPVFCDEGNLYLGFAGLVPGSMQHILFQFAEATANAETPRDDPRWYYLQHNTWKPLRKGFEIIDDQTSNFSTSGIVRISTPENMTNDNTILPKGLHWIRISVKCNTKAFSELIGVHTQAVKAVFQDLEGSDLSRLEKPLPAGMVSKLLVADSSVSKITQPYPSFRGRTPEVSGHYYVRVSEHLRHKGRAIQKFDYERLVLEQFPEVFKTKCINHTYALDANKYINDFTISPGYVMVAVIPDMRKLEVSGSFEPGLPLATLLLIEAMLKRLHSPFVRLKVMNPRYEKVNLCLRIKLHPGKDKSFYKQKLEQDLRCFLAPWAVGEFEKLSFGQPVYRSDLVEFLENREYLDYIIELHMRHQDHAGQTITLGQSITHIEPISPRSILIAGNIDICIDEPECEQWCTCEGECCDHQPIPFRQTKPQKQR